jgi:predicted amidohydrolase YtcJ
MTTTVFQNARIFSPETCDDGFLSTMVIVDDSIANVGFEDCEQVRQAKYIEVTVNLDKRVVLPSFIDAHVHILNFGLSLQKLDLMQ